MPNPILFNGSAESFAVGIKKGILLEDRMCLVLITGDPGSGKSTLMARMTMILGTPELSRKDLLVRNIVYPYEKANIRSRIYQIQLEIGRYEPIGIDEAGAGSSSDAWNSLANRAVFEFLQFKREVYKDVGKEQKERLGNNLVIFCMPKMKKFTNAIRSFAKFWIKCISVNPAKNEGFAIVMAKGETERDDDWCLKSIDKLEKEYTERTGKPSFLWAKEDYVNVYRELPTFLGVILFQSLEPEEQTLYSQMKGRTLEEEQGTTENDVTSREKRQRLMIGKASIALESICLELGSDKFLTIQSRAKYLGLSTTGLWKCERLAEKLHNKVEEIADNQALLNDLDKLKELSRSGG